MALAAAGLVASAEQGYSLVGYVNVTITNGFNFVANPFDVTGVGAPNLLSNVFSGESVPQGTKAYLWDVASQAFSTPSTYTALTTRWSINYDVFPGKGFVLQSPSLWTATFVGQVLLGTNTILVPGNGKWSLLAAPLPLAGAFLSTTNVPPFPAVDGDSVFLFDNSGQVYPDHPVACFNGFGWFDSAQPAQTDGPVINIAQPFFILNAGSADTNWVEVYNLEARPAGSGRLAAQGAAAPDISRITVAAGKVTLAILNPGGGPYDVQFSTDRLSWTTVAASQTGATWTGPAPAGVIGYYQVVQP